MYNDYNIFLDYDGVLLNSEELMVKRHRESNLSWDDFFDNLDWHKLYREAEEINGSFEVVRELQGRQSGLYILTKIHRLIEANAKIELLREAEITVPVFIVPPHIKKSEIYLPDAKSLLIDDSEKNINDWRANGGHGILFNSNIVENISYQVKSLHFLLK